MWQRGQCCRGSFRGEHPEERRAVVLTTGRPLWGVFSEASCGEHAPLSLSSWGGWSSGGDLPTGPAEESRAFGCGWAGRLAGCGSPIRLPPWGQARRCHTRETPAAGCQASHHVRQQQEGHGGREGRQGRDHLLLRLGPGPVYRGGVMGASQKSLLRGGEQ